MAISSASPEIQARSKTRHRLPPRATTDGCVARHHPNRGAGQRPKGKAPHKGIGAYIIPRAPTSRKTLITCALAAKAALAASVIIAAVAPPINAIDTQPNRRNRLAPAPRACATGYDRPEPRPAPRPTGAGAIPAGQIHRPLPPLRSTAGWAGYQPANPARTTVQAGRAVRLSKRPRAGHALGAVCKPSTRPRSARQLALGGRNPNGRGPRQLIAPTIRQAPGRQRQRQGKDRQKRHCSGTEQGQRRGKPVGGTTRSACASPHEIPPLWQYPGFTGRPPPIAAAGWKSAERAPEHGPWRPGSGPGHGWRS